MDALPHILIVDDDPRIRTMLRRYLSEEGFKVTEADGGPAMRTALAAGGADLVLLDLVMPGEDGLTLARQIRHDTDIPVIILTGKGDVIDRVAGLEIGADDYIAKPFHLREVLARIRTVLRRAQPRQVPPPPAAAQPRPAEPNETATFDRWRLDFLRRELRTAEGTAVALTATEFDLLAALVRHPNRVLSRDQITDLVKGPGWAAFDRTVDTQIVRLRRKIERQPDAPELIRTVRGAGYILAAVVRWA
ncbi:MAG: response regulator [Proteobacteria bacterium]|nr:response regulator [Pseudomonadota bacterium]